MVIITTIIIITNVVTNYTITITARERLHLLLPTYRCSTVVTINCMLTSLTLAIGREARDIARDRARF